MSWSPLGRPIRVGVFEHNPDAFNCFRRIPRGNCNKPGSEMEIIAMVMKILDWQWEVIDTEREYHVVNDFGNPLPGGNFSGLMGLLESEEIDMSGLSMRITPHRMLKAHFTFPIRYFQQIYIVRTPPEHDFRNFVFAPFSTELWILLLATIMSVSTMRFICALYWDFRVGSKFNIYSSSVLETFGLMLKQRVQNSSMLSTMILEGFLIIAMIAIAQMYQTSMNSRLTAPPSSQIPFLHQNQLVQQLLKKRTHLTYYFNISLEGSNEKNEQAIRKSLYYNPIAVHYRDDDLIEEIGKGGVFYSTYDVEFLPHAVSTWDRRKDLTVIRDTTALLKILPGIAQITLGPGYGTKKTPEDISVEVKKTRLSLKKHLEQLFYIYLVGCLLSIMIFVFEVLFYRIHVLKRQKIYRINHQESDSPSEFTFTPLPN